MAAPKMKFPIANTHVHLEAAISVKKLAELAKKNRQSLPDSYKSGKYEYTELGSFLKNYDELNTRFIRSADDYYELTKDYLQRTAADGGIYTDLIVSPAHGLISGIEYPDLIKAINHAIDDVPQIKATISLTAVRGPADHEFYGPENALKWAKEAAKYKDEAWHQKVTSFGIAGYEFSQADHFSQYAEAMRVAHEEAGLVKRVHAGESWGRGTQLVRDALALDPAVIDHGLEIASDPALMAEVREKGIFVTHCRESNALLIEALKGAAEPPRRVLRRAGIRVPLGDDDPLFFGKTIAEEHKEVQKEDKLTDKEMLEFTKDAIDMPIVPQAMKVALRGTIAAYETQGRDGKAFQARA